MSNMMSPEQMERFFKSSVDIEKDYEDKIKDLEAKNIELEKKLTAAQERIDSESAFHKEAGRLLTIEQKKLEIAIEALKSIKHEHLDDKTPVRFIESLKKWRDRACKISWEALAAINKTEGASNE